MLRIIFMGTASLACASLEALLGRPDWSVMAVVTQPDKPQGRKLELKPTPVKECALQHGLKVLQPTKLRSPESVAELTALQPDLIVVTAYGQILPQSILDLPRHGCLNIHTSILPRHRGAAPIQWAILEGDQETGVTLMLMDAGLDTGPMLAETRTPIRDEDNAETLHDRLALLGGQLLRQAIPEWIEGRLKPRPQPAEGATYARKIEKSDGWLDWNLPARVLWNRVRGLSPWPGAFCERKHADQTQMLKVWEARVEKRGSTAKPGTVLESGPEGVLVACGGDTASTEALRLGSLQREGGKRLPARDFLLGNPIAAGEQWG